MKKRFGIKSSLDSGELRTKMAAAPDTPVLELFLIGADINEQLLSKVKKILATYPDIVLTLHAPVRADRTLVELEQVDALPIYDVLCDICEKEERVIGIVCHAGFRDKENILKQAASLRMEHQRCPEYIYVEICIGPLYEDPADFADLVHEMGMKKIVYDFAHFTSAHTEQELIDGLKYLRGEFEVYCHISDNICRAGSCFPLNVGDGELDFSKVLPLVDIGIIETYSSDESVGKEMIDDYHALHSLRL